MKKESGLYIVLVAMMLFMLMGLIVLVIGLGAIGTNKTRLQNAANSAALAALEGYVNAPASATNHDLKAAHSLSRTNAILGKNTMPGTARELGDLGLHPLSGPGGELEFGMWFSKDPDPLTPGTPCLEYPCFRTYNEPDFVDVNAARVNVHNQSDNPLIVAMAGIIGRSSFFLESNATAALAPRCVGYLMDVSGSAQYETHPRPSAPPTEQVAPFNPCYSSCGGICEAGTCKPPLCEQCLDHPPHPRGDPLRYYPDYVAANAGVAFLRQNQVQPGGINIDCREIGNYTSSEAFHWCNYFRSPRFEAPAPGMPFRHNRNDYESERANIEGTAIDVLVDKLYEPGVYEGPQPLTRNFLAFNAGLRYVESTSSPGDLSVVMAFTSSIRDRYPDPAVPGQGELTKDMGFLIQLTNVENRGMKRWDGDTTGLPPEIHPNFIDRGWFPVSVANGSQTNLVKALEVTANALHSECLPTSRKAIVLATDGVSSCFVTDEPNPQPVCPSIPAYATYQTAESQLLTTDIYSGAPGIPNIKQLLKDWEISLTALVDSSGVRPNFYSIRTNASGCSYGGLGANPSDPKCFVSYEQARALGYGGLGDPLSYFDFSSYVPPALANTEENAYLNFGQPGVIFGRPIGALGKIAIETGGFMCGLLGVAPVGAYVDFYGDRKDSSGNTVACDATNCDTSQYQCSPCVLNGGSTYRAVTCDPQGGIPCGAANVQLWSTEYLPKSEQAARCVRNTVGLNPFTLVAKDTEL